MLRQYLVLSSLIAIVLLSGCATRLPTLPPEQKPSSQTLISEPSRSETAKTISAMAKAHPGQSGVYPLGDGIDAFVARLALIDKATTSVDVQYYIYRADTTGNLLTAVLMNAAERGVRVRLLLDDMNTSGKDSAFALLSNHPNVEIRLFNPFLNRFRRGLEFLGNINRANRRMHNKSITVDGRITIVGGRNIGDEYFSADQSLEFGDFDLLAIGPVVNEITQQFDLYWNSEAAYPAKTLIKPLDEPWSETRDRINTMVQRYQESDYVRRLKTAHIISDISREDAPIYWGKAYALYDPPSKAIPTSDSSRSRLPEEYMLPQLVKVLDDAQHSLVLVSPYFVPGDAGVELLKKYRRNGIDISIITNSLAATDVVAVHGGYRKYRTPLLESGVKLYEVRVDANVKPGSWKGSSRASLHAKTFYVDDKTLFVGSFNFDPRSAALNTELGIVIESPELIKTIKDNASIEISKATYKVELTDKGVRWFGADGTYQKEPQASLWRRMGAILMGWLPIEQHL